MDIALNDQLKPGNGQLGVFKGMHEDVEAAFRMEPDTGGVIRSEGLGWPRIKIGEKVEAAASRKVRERPDTD